MSKIPVLFVIFNRPDRSIKSFQSIKRYRPERLYIAADGPRKERSGEEDLCARTREIILKEIDWDCEVYRLFRNENVGCGRGVSEAISWMFETEDFGMVIEDDCVASDDLFLFCEQLLPYYKDDDRIAQINGFVPKYSGCHSSEFYFTGYPEIWGWATWKRAWKNIDFGMSNWGKVKHGLLKRFNFKEACIHYILWSKLHKRIISGEKPNAWGLQWSIYVFMNHKLCIEPRANLVSNIGFGGESTNCSVADNPMSRIKYGKLDSPISIPKEVMIDIKQEKARTIEFTNYYQYLLFNKIKRVLTNK